jgi:hypothetical protein
MIRRMKGCITLLAFLFIGTIGHSQSSAPKHASLTVTLTVGSSVGLVLDRDGKNKVIIANSPDPAQTFAPPASTAPAVEYRFPGHAAAFEIHREIVSMNVESAGRKQREPVTVTTVVAK